MTHYPSPPPAGFRLRFESQELALVHGVTLLGREPGCLITLLDALVSRRHARIRCDGDTAVIEDLGSRNGTRVNGILISGPHFLRDGDRIGLGSHTLVVGVAHAGASGLSETGVMEVMAQSGTRSSGGWTKTPSKAPPARAEDTTAQARWSLGMLLEMLGKAKLSGRAVDAERVLREVVIAVEDQLRSGVLLEAEELHALDDVTAWLSRTQQDASWSQWLDSVRAKRGITLLPPAR